VVATQQICRKPANQTRNYCAREK